MDELNEEMETVNGLENKKISKSQSKTVKNRHNWKKDEEIGECINGT